MLLFELLEFLKQLYVCEASDLQFLVFVSEKLLNSSGRELRRALFSLKQIFQVNIQMLFNLFKFICNIPKKKCVTAGGVDTKVKEFGKHTRQWMTNDVKSKQALSTL